MLSKRRTNRFERYFLVAFVVLIALCFGTLCGAQETDGPKVKNTYFEYSGHKIRCDWYKAAGDNSKPPPVVLIFHGSGGIEDNGWFFQELAKAIARTGTTAVIVHYFESCGIRWADGAAMSKYFGMWLNVIHDAISYVKRQKDIDPYKVSLLGHSLGAQLSLHAAATDPSISSVVDMSGCFVLPTSKITRMPKILIVHCADDHTVPMRKERNLVLVLKRCHAGYIEHIYPKGGHVFNEVAWDDMLKTITDFLGQFKK